ncbi:LAFA_0B02256g1_1 [Lachancea sp. 'fantastica']|nr:LAFA_0B02256g1_1 [Lachancea sp. 'fantastica']
MFLAKRCSSRQLRRSYSQAADLKSLYKNILKEKPFQQLVQTKNLNEELSPYDFSEFVLKGLAGKQDLNIDRSLLHNRVIESLTAHDYGVGSVHAKELQKLGGQLSPKSLAEIIKGNPGRVKSSWEIFTDNWKTAKDSQEVLGTIFTKLLSFDSADIADGKTDLTLQDVTKSIFLLSLIEDVSIIQDDAWEALLRACLATKATTIVPYILKHYKPSETFLLNEDLQLTDYQTCQLFQQNPEVLLCENSSMFRDVFTILGQNEFVQLTEEELEADRSIQHDLQAMRQTSNSSFSISSPAKLATKDSFDSFLAVVEHSDSESDTVKELYTTAVRSLGIYKNDVNRASLFFDKVKKPHPRLYDEMFLVYTFNGVKGADEMLIKEAMAFSPNQNPEALPSIISRGLIAGYSVFDLEKSLTVFNDNIKSSNKKPSDNNSVSDAALLTEALVVAFLRNKDRDFAQVILEKAASEQILPSKTAVQLVKRHLTSYGTMLEESDFDQNLQNMVLDYIKSL